MFARSVTQGSPGACDTVVGHELLDDDA
jgi:hypothetical protein